MKPLRFIVLGLAVVMGWGASAQETAANPAAAPRVRLVIFGLEHGHANGFIPKARAHPAIQLVGIVEANPEVAAKYAKRHQLPADMIVGTLAELQARGPIDAVAAFTNTFAHRAVVEACAAQHIHVMMEKPLAVNMEHARAMQAAAQQGGIHVLVNYETTWYPSNQTAYDLVTRQHLIGGIRKMVAHDGHRGPKGINSPPEFLGWLTDPVRNGGGAVMDFGCYGANLMTWLMGGQRPLSVTAVLQNLKPAVYPRVDDEATIILTYPDAQGIIQASWNWPFARKDLELYGETGTVVAVSGDVLRRQTDAKQPAVEQTLPPPSGPMADSLSYLAAVVRGQVEPSGLSSLENNLVVTEILDAARQSAQSGKSIKLAE